MKSFYKKPIEIDDIKQGDIFLDLPFTDISLSKLTIFDRTTKSVNTKSWEEVKDDPEIEVGVRITKTIGIVISQNCDNLRNEFISFATISLLSELNKTLPTKPLKWANYIKDIHKKYNYQVFYLPQSKDKGIIDRMYVNFDEIFQLPLDDLLTRRKSLRVACLGDESLAHFRDSLSKYFTRYANKEWYSFTKEEFEAYKGEIGKDKDNEKELLRILPYDHQK